MLVRKRCSFLVWLLAGALMALPLAACGGKASQEEEPQQTQEASPQAEESEKSTGVANPFVDCSSAYDAAQVAGFEVTFPESVPGYATRMYQAVEDQLVQCFYGNEGDDARVLIRKGKGVENISGDYNEYAVTETVTIGDVTVEERGDGTLIHVATWSRDGYDYAIDADNGLDAATIEHLVNGTA